MLQQTTTQSSERRFLRHAEVEAKAGFKRAHIYALMKDGKFPKAVRLGGAGLLPGIRSGSSTVFRTASVHCMNGDPLPLNGFLRPMGESR